MMNKIQVNNLSNILFAQFFSQLEQLKKKTMLLIILLLIEHVNFWIVCF